MAEEETSPKQEEQDVCEVIIIGAGLAGLTAAHHLAKNGITNFKILEARNRIGGRIVSISLGSQRIELGANWIHGVLGNPIYEMALGNRLVDITLSKKPHNVVATTEEGKRVPIMVLQEIYETYFWFFKKCEEYFLCKTPCPPDVASVGGHLMKDIDEYLSRYDAEEGNLRRMIFNHLLSRETCITGCTSMNDIDLVDFGCYTELPGGNLTIPQGFSSILGCLTSSFSSDCIYKSHAVKCIRWRKRQSGTPLTPGVPPSFGLDPFVNNQQNDLQSSKGDLKVPSTHQRTVEVECENGKKFYSDHVVITIPLGVLKAKLGELFEPPLPEYKAESIQRLCFGTVDKIFLEYERPFLHPDISEVITLWDPRTEAEDISKNWFRKIYSFTKLNETMLLAWLSGKEAEYAETLPAEQIAEVCTTLLRKFLNDPFVPKPVKVVRTRWFSEPYTRGSYSAIAVGSSQRDLENLAKPIYVHPYDHKPTLLFAGEATHPTFFSTTHGAYLTGRTAADLLLVSDRVTSADPTESELNEMSSWIQGISLT